jgi:translation initiation factor 5B
MAPKKKGNKKAQEDDWEAEMGETITPQNGADEPKAEDATPADDAAGGGLIAALQRRGKKGKKNKNADFELEGEDPPADGADGADGADAALEAKAPQEATFDDDDDDVFAGNYGKKKGKGGAAAAAAAAAVEKQEEPQEEKTDDAPRVKTKAEKEKEKKEKEKQRKKELVSLCTMQSIIVWSIS